MKTRLLKKLRESGPKIGPAPGVTLGDGFQLNHFKVAQWNFCDVVNIGFDWS